MALTLALDKFIQSCNEVTLKYIIGESSKFSEFVKIYNAQHDQTIDDKFSLSRLVNNSLSLKKRYRVTLSFGTLLEVASVPFDIFLFTMDAIIKTFSASLFIASIGITAGCILVGIIAFAYDYFNSRRRDKQSIQDYHWNLVKIAAFEELIKRKYPNQAKLFYSTQDQSKSKSNNLKNSSLKNNSTKVPKLHSVGVGVLASTALATTFFWGVTDMMVTFGVLSAATSLMSGPVGLAFGFALAIGFGVALAIMHYKARKNKKIFKHQINITQESLETKKTAFQILTNLSKIKNQPNTNTNNSGNESKNKSTKVATRKV